MLYYYFMKLIFGLLIFINSASAWSCSYAFKPASEVLNDVDLVFEADIRAVYVNGKQVSTQVLGKHVASLGTPATLRYRLTVRQIYLGQVDDELDVYVRYDPLNSCTSFFRNATPDLIWGADFDNGRYHANGYNTWVAVSIRSLLQSMDEYRDGLHEAIERNQLSAKGNRIAIRELSLIETQLNNLSTNLLTQMVSRPFELKNLPGSILTLRETLLNHTNLKLEIAKTSMAIAELGMPTSD